MICHDCGKETETLVEIRRYNAARGEYGIVAVHDSRLECCLNRRAEAEVYISEVVEINAAIVTLEADRARKLDALMSIPLYNEIPGIDAVASDISCRARDKQR